VIPGEVVGNKTLLYPLLEDIALLHGAALTQSCGDFWAHGGMRRRPSSAQPGHLSTPSSRDVVDETNITSTEHVK
jgi:hypothetical protein